MKRFSTRARQLGVESIRHPTLLSSAVTSSDGRAPRLPITKGHGVPSPVGWHDDNSSYEVRLSARSATSYLAWQAREGGLSWLAGEWLAVS